jgi:hypothetical protein
MNHIDTVSPCKGKEQNTFVIKNMQHHKIELIDFFFHLKKCSILFMWLSSVSQFCTKFP